MLVVACGPGRLGPAKRPGREVSQGCRCANVAFPTAGETVIGLPPALAISCRVKKLAWLSGYRRTRARGASADKGPELLESTIGSNGPSAGLTTSSTNSVAIRGLSTVH